MLTHRPSTALTRRGFLGALGLGVAAVAAGVAVQGLEKVAATREATRATGARITRITLPDGTVVTPTDWVHTAVYETVDISTRQLKAFHQGLISRIVQ